MFRVQGSGFRVQGLGFRVQGFGVREYMSSPMSSSLPPLWCVVQDIRVGSGCKGSVWCVVQDIRVQEVRVQEFGAQGSMLDPGCLAISGLHHS